MEEEKKLEQEAFEIFAKLHPIEAYNTYTERFCDHIRSQGIDMTNEEIGKTIYDIELVINHPTKG